MPRKRPNGRPRAKRNVDGAQPNLNDTQNPTFRVTRSSTRNHPAASSLVQLPDGSSSPIPPPQQSPASVVRPETEHILSLDNYGLRITRSQDQGRSSADISPLSNTLPDFQEQVFVGDVDLQPGISPTESELPVFKQPTLDIQIGGMDGSLQAEEVDTGTLLAANSVKTHDLRSRTSPVPTQSGRGQK